MARPTDRRLLPVRGLAVSLIAVGTASVFLSNSSGSAQSSSAPGLAESVRAMEDLPTVAIPSRLVAHAMGRAANAMGGDSARATETLKLLRSNLGSESGTIYAYSPRVGILCVLHWPRAGTCATGTNPARPGVALLSSPGGPGYPGAVADLPAAVAGVGADNVSSVALSTNGRARPLLIENNTFFSEIPWPASERPWDIAVIVKYANGSEAVTEIPDPRG